MIGDIWTVVWKEWREILAQGGGGRRGKLSLILLLGVFGVFLPLQSGRAWLESPFLLVAWGWLPFMLVSSVVADSFAGERERHTLETLLASRLPDRAILFGKLAAAIGYGCGLVLVMASLSVVTVNLAYGRGALLFFPVRTAVWLPAFTLLGSGLAAGAGELVSLCAATVRQAQQTFSLAILLLFSPVFVFPVLPAEMKARIVSVISRLDLGQVALLGAGLVAVLDVVLILAAMARFRRARLILD